MKSEPKNGVRSFGRRLEELEGAVFDELFVFVVSFRKVSRAKEPWVSLGMAWIIIHNHKGFLLRLFSRVKAFAARTEVKEVGLDSCVSYRDRSRGEMRSFSNAGRSSRFALAFSVSSPVPFLAAHFAGATALYFFELLSSVFYR